ncbi:MAG TPA: peptidogalycan biosysnthesis protein [Chitinophagales bacterium]|nr:peptidogalycan biosysnthesis protein [Chitinophagales bacterium]
MAGEGKSVTAVRYEHIAEIPEEVWDKTCDELDPFHRHAFLLVTEAAKVENSIARYLLFKNDERMTGSAVLSIFYVDLAIFIGNNSVIRLIKKRRPNFFQLKMLFCGTPVSLGQSNLRIEPGYEDEVIHCLAEEMKAFAKEHGIRHLVAKEFREEEMKTRKRFRSEKFFSGFSIPYMNMEVRWNSFEAFLQQLRSPYRRAVLRSIRKIAGNDANKPVYSVQPISCANAKSFYKDYLAVMDRAAVKLETLNQNFFEEFFTSYPDKAKLISCGLNGDEARALILEEKNELFFLLVARRNARDDEQDSYYNLLYSILDYAFTRRVKRLHMGQTSYWAKARIGCVAEEEYLYYQPLNPVMRFLLKNLSLLLFPKTKLKTPHVFKIDPDP